MTVEDQNREEVPSPTTDLLKPKQNIKIGCWNVRTLNQAGRLAQTIAEMNKYGLAMLGVT